MATSDERALTARTTFKRRSALHALWTTPVVLAASASPAFAASVVTFRITNGSLVSGQGQFKMRIIGNGTFTSVTIVSVVDQATTNPTSVQLPNPATISANGGFVDANNNNSYAASHTYTVTYSVNGGANQTASVLAS